MKMNQQLPKDLVLAVALAAKKKKGSADAELDEGRKATSVPKSIIVLPILAAYQTILRR